MNCLYFAETSDSRLSDILSPMGKGVNYCKSNSALLLVGHNALIVGRLPVSGLGHWWHGLAGDFSISVPQPALHSVSAASGLLLSQR
jgi:hypothetical protein